MAKILMQLGCVLFLLGLILYIGSHFLNLGMLPGDIVFKRKNFSFYFPIVSSIIVSILLTLLLNILWRK